MKVLFLLFISATAYSYPHYIGHGYTSCQTCHYNPLGGGMVNDYGRVVNATAIASDAFYPKSWDNEKVAYHSDFLAGVYRPKNMRLQANYRGLYLVRNPGEKSEDSEYIPMQTDLRALLKFNDDRLLISASASYTPAPRNPRQGQDPEARLDSREHYIGYKFTPSFGVYAGLLDKAYGIRVVEHVAYSRLAPRLTQNDQSHGVMMHFLSEKWEVGAHGFIGNLAEEENLRLRGASTIVERTVGDIHRIGFSFLSNENEFVNIQSAALHSRLSFKSGSSLQFELGQTQTVKISDDSKKSARYGLLQTYIRPFRGLYVFTNMEYSKPDLERDDYIVRWGPGIQYLPIHRTELRAELQNIRNFNEEKSVKDTWALLLQAHFWL